MLPNDQSSVERFSEAPPTPLSISPTPAAPLIDRDRITAIDALRGFALLGILLMNIQSFAMPGVAYMNPTAFGDLEGVNYWVWHFKHLLADQKFMTIFSMLFGAGIVLMASRIEAKGHSAMGIHYRRMAWLILFGLLHAHLIWYGDILFFYGVCGLVAWWFRLFRPAWLIVLGMLAIIVPMLISFGFGFMLLYGSPEFASGFESFWSPDQATLDAELADYRGTWLEQMPSRMGSAAMFETAMFIMWGAWRAGGLMLIGMALYKMGVFSAKRSKSFYLWMLLIGAAIGLPLISYGIHRNFAENWSVGYSYAFGSQFNYVGSVFVSLAWVGALMLIIKSSALTWLMRRLQAVGQMALTNYLLHSIICTLIFYGHGLGYFGHVDRTGQLLIVIGIWIAQLLWSPIWLRYFQFGPFEWSWRTLTYWRLQPVLRRDARVLMSSHAPAG